MLLYVLGGPRNCCVVTWFLMWVMVTLYLIQNLMFLREMTRKAGLLKANAEPAKAPRERDQRESWEVAQLHQFIIWSWINPVSICFSSICCLIFSIVLIISSALCTCFSHIWTCPIFSHLFGWSFKPIYTRSQVDRFHRGKQFMFSKSRSRPYPRKSNDCSVLSRCCRCSCSETLNGLK